ncbi:RagB/SusD family nutrient uptake outer membrane protein [Limibacter armeniacum]|uniref:RagB/SusD family nutrient uptake outer membrane protein n=1 Tax=Limibacter armeniacum TaxID=466084 RepID=UPI002FE53483
MKGISKYILIAALGLSAASCESVIDFEPTDQIDKTKAFTSVDDLDAAIVGAYAIMPKTTPITVNAYTTDNAKMAVGGRNIGVTSYNWNYTPSGSTEPAGWAGYYRSVNAVNVALDAMQQLTIPVSDSERYDYLKGEAMAVRALAHFNLFQAYAASYTDDSKLAVPYMLVSEIAQPARLTVGEFMTKLDQDLEQAYQLMNGNESVESINTRMSALAVKALEARVALYREDYDRAVAAATAVLSVVTVTDAAGFTAMFEQGADDEIIFKFRMSDPLSKVGNVFQDNGGTLNFVASNDLDLAFAQNYADDASLDVRYGVTLKMNPADASQQLIGKYMSADATEILLTDVNVFRASDILLIRAEANAQLGSAAAAQADLNELRAKRIEGFTDQAETGNILLDAIAQQRRLELAYEGHRFYDLRRTGKSIVRGDVTFETTPTTLVAGDHRFVFPIPESEINANENMTQNDKYDGN